MTEQTIELIFRIATVILSLLVALLGYVQLFKRPLQSRGDDVESITQAAKNAVDVAVKGFESRISQLEKDVKDRDAKIESLTARLEIAERAVQERDAKIDDLEKRLGIAENEKREMIEEIETLRARLDALKPRK